MAFQFAPVLWAGGAAAAPVIIHLIMRTRPRRIVFPPVEFIHRIHQANIKMHRLKHLILLLLRMAAIVLAAMLIARWSLAGWRVVPRSSEPAAVVIVLDNSGSMGYRAEGQTVLARAKELAARLIDSLPAGSRFAVVASSDPQGAVGFVGDVGRAAERLRAVDGTYGDEPVAPAIRQAGALLDDVTELNRKEVYIFTDMTAHSWREGSGTRIKTDADRRFVAVNCGAGDSNAALGDVRLSAESVPVGAEVAVRAVVYRPRNSPELSVTTELEGRAVHQKLLAVPAGGASPVTLLVKPGSRGIAAGRVRLSGMAADDPLEVDNERHFAVTVGSPAQLLAVHDRTVSGGADPTSLLMETAIAPPGTAAAAGQWVGKTAISSDSLDAERLKGADIVLLANLSGVTAAQWAALGRHVEQGGGLWIVPGRLLSPEGYNSPEAQAVMPVELSAMEAKTATWKIPEAERAHALLEPFVSGGNPPLTGVRCRRRFGVKSVAAGARVIVSYDDGVPAIVWRNVGDGNVVFWNFSPAGDFTNLASAKPKQFVVLTQRTLELMIGSRRTMYLWSETVTVPAPRRMDDPAVEVARPGEGYRPEKFDAASRALTIARADRLGLWRVRFSRQGEESRVYGFCVNAPYAESDLEAMDEARLREMFPPDSLEVTSDVGETGAPGQTVAQNLDLAAPVLLVLLVLMVYESFFANRFYRRAGAAAESGTGISG